MQIFKIINNSCLVMLLLTAVNIPSLAIDSQSQNTGMNTCSWSGNNAIVAAPYDPVDVENCISEASSKIGEVTIRIPAANLVWQDRVTVDMSQGFELVSSITLTGTGNPTGIGSSGQTVITDNRTRENIPYDYRSPYGFTFKGITDKRFRLSNMELKGAAGIHISGTSRVSESGGFRIDHITFEYIGWERPLKIMGRTYGVLDHNMGGSDGPAFAIIRESIGVENGIDGGNSAWHNNSDGFGSIDAVYFEDNNFTLLPAGERSGMVFDGDSGSKIVARHNVFNNYYIGGHDVSSIGDSRSALYYEIYENDLNTTFSWGSALISLRGGTSRVFNNKIIANNPVGEPPFYLTEQGNPGGISMTNYRSFGLASVEPWNNICGQTSDIKACTGRINGDARACVNDSECGGVPQSCEAIDGPIMNNIEGAGYPCRDQIGRGINHELVPALFWNNTLNIRGAGANVVIPLVYVDAQQHIRIDRDFCHSIDDMPTSCGGVITTYTPLVYPHPLIQDDIFIDGFESPDA